MRSHHLYDISTHRTPHTTPEDSQNSPKRVVFLHVHTVQ